MRKFVPAVLSVAAVAAVASLARVQSESDSTDRLAQGVVYHDANNNGQRDPREKPLAGVRVSNGKDIVTTDDNG